jgi:two-component system, cell cycle sensor histidine kinase and response regulator CckA
MIEKNQQSKRPGSLRKRAEEFLKNTPSAIKNGSSQDMKNLIEDLQIYQVELEMQNEELRRTQLELQESRDRFSGFYEFAPVGYFTISDKGLIQEVNLTGTTMLGVERRSLIAKPFSRFITGDDQNIFYSHLKRLFETKTAESCELRIAKEDDSQFYGQLKSIAIKNDDGAFTSFRVVLGDIDDRKRAENILRESEEIYRNIISESPVGISIYDASGQCMEANDAIAQIIGATKEQVLQQNFNDIEPWKKSEFLDKARSAVKDQSINRHDLSVKSTFGKDVKLDAYLVPFVSGSLLLMVNDITDRIKTEEALRESEEKFRNIAESSFDMIFRADKKGFITYVSPSANRILHYEPDAAMGKHFSDFLLESEIPRVSEAFDQMLRGKEVGFIQMDIRRKDGSNALVELSGSRILKQGETVGIQGIIRDITERRKLDEERLKREKLETLGILAGGLAHNFNNILTVIMGNIYLAKQDLDRDSDPYEILQEAEKETGKARRLTKQFLTFTKGGAPVKETASLAEVIRGSASFVLKGSNVRCDFIIPEGTWLTEIDVGQISQVAQNLLINADQATPEGGTINIEIENRVIEAKDVLPIPSGKYVHVSVRDVGCGIPEKNLPKIFDPYFSTKDKGSGLGLATVHSIIERHSGHITVDSELGAGTAFDFYLPASETQMVETSSVEGGLIRGDGRVLVMDHEEPIRHLAYQALGRLGYEVDAAKDGEEAIEKYIKSMKEGRPFDAVILGLTVPGGMGGKETIRQLKEIDPGVKAAVTSGYSHNPVMTNFRDYGFSGAVPKPFGINKLGRVLHDMIWDKDS